MFSKRWPIKEIKPNDCVELENADEWVTNKLTSMVRCAELENTDEWVKKLTSMVRWMNEWRKEGRKEDIHTKLTPCYKQITQIRVQKQRYLNKLMNSYNLNMLKQTKGQTEGLVNGFQIFISSNSSSHLTSTLAAPYMALIGVDGSLSTIYSFIQH